MITGKNVIGNTSSANGTASLRAYNPDANAHLPEVFTIATEEEVRQAMNKATEAFPIYRQTAPVARAAFLETIAREILDCGDALLERAVAESGLPLARITGERQRTINQLHLFAAVLREGSWVDAVIDPGTTYRKESPRPDLRKMLVPLGPVLVFPASNFPLAFSTAGGDTASALAAGNPVVIKAHESHPGTNELVATAIQRAVQKCRLPEGVFSSLTGIGTELGQTLVKHPAVKAIGFTGSYKAGMAIYHAAASREQPVPVYAEMGSVNPVLLLPGKLAAAGQQIAQQYAASITQGVGQFCTNPGVLIALEGAATDAFIPLLTAAIAAIGEGTMLNTGICEHYYSRRQLLSKQPGVQCLYAGDNRAAQTKGTPALYQVSGTHFIKNPLLQQEVFGPSSLLVVCNGEQELMQVIAHLQGQLTGTVMCLPEEQLHFEAAITALADKTGRMVFNGVPTGVEVGYAMMHGGPFPATTDLRSTSVGADAILRFVRPLCFQDYPPALLPDALKDDNPLGIWRKVDGERTTKAIS